VSESGTPGSGEERLAHLLEVQDHDTAVDQLRHRQATMPERVELRQVEAVVASISERLSKLQGERDELSLRQSALEEQIEASRKRRSELEKRMYGGQIAAARDLQAMDDETRHLGRHVSELEDREIEVMEALEPLDSELASANAERSELEGRAVVLRQAISESGAELETAIDEEMKARNVAASAVPDELIARYEKLRAKLGGTGAARLVGNSCSGCHLTLPAMEVDRIRKMAPDAIITCDQCGRILVR